MSYEYSWQQASLLTKQSGMKSLLLLDVAYQVDSIARLPAKASTDAKDHKE